MKKLLIATLCASAFALTACDKKTADTATAKETAPAVALSSNNAADIKSDLAAIKALSIAKAQESTEAQTKLLESAKTGDKAAVEEMVKGMKTFTEGYNKELDALALKSSEVDSARQKMKEFQNVNVELSEAAISAKPDPTKMGELAKKAGELQQALAAEMQKLEAKAAEVK